MEPDEEQEHNQLPMVYKDIGRGNVWTDLFTSRTDSQPLSQLPPPLPPSPFDFGVSTDSNDSLRQSQQPLPNSQVPEHYQLVGGTSIVTLTNIISKCVNSSGKTIKLELDEIQYVARSCSRIWIKPLLKYFDPKLFYELGEDKYDSDSDSEDEDGNRVKRRNPHECSVYIGIAPKKSGKTFASDKLLIVYAQKNGTQLRTLSVTPRISFAGFFVDGANVAFVESGTGNVFRNYQEFSKLTKAQEIGKTEEEIVQANANYKFFLGDIPNLAIQLDSIPRLFIQRNVDNWDLVFFDEFKATLRHMSTSFVKEKRALCGYISNIFSKARCIVFTDADMDEFTVKIIHLFLKLSNSQTKVRIDINTVRNDDRIYNIYPNITMLIEDLIIALNNKEKIIMPTTSINWVRKVVEVVREKVNRPLKILEITGESVKSTDKFDKMDSRNWEEYDLVIYTGKVTVGISYEKWVDKIFCIFSSGTNGAQEAAQMTYRARNVRSKIVNIWCAGNIQTAFFGSSSDSLADLKKWSKELKWPFYATKATTLNAVMKGLKAKKNIVIYTNSPDHAKMISCDINRHIKTKFQILDLAKVEDEKSLGYDVWNKYDLIICAGSGTLSSKIQDWDSFVQRFDQIFCIFSVCTAAPEESEMLIEEVKSTRCEDVSIWCADVKGDALDEIYTIQISRLQSLLEEKYNDVMARANTSRFTFSKGANEFCNDIYTLIYKNNAMEEMKNRQNLLKEVLEIIRRYVVSPDNIRRVVERKTELDLSEIIERLSDEKNLAIAEAKNIDKETYDKLREMKDDIPLELKYQVDKYKLASFYNVKPDTITFEFVKKWRPKVYGLKNFCIVFLESKEEMLKNEDHMLQDRDNDTLIHLIFDDEVKALFLSILDVYRFKIDAMDSFEFHSAISDFDIDKLNDLIPRFIVKSRIRTNTKLRWSEVNSFLRKMMGMLGIPYITSKVPIGPPGVETLRIQDGEKVTLRRLGVAAYQIEVDLKSMFEILKMLCVKYSGKPQTVQIKKWIVSVPKSRYLTQIEMNPKKKKPLTPIQKRLKMAKSETQKCKECNPQTNRESGGDGDGDDDDANDSDVDIQEQDIFDDVLIRQRPLPPDVGSLFTSDFYATLDPLVRQYMENQDPIESNESVEEITRQRPIGSVSNISDPQEKRRKNDDGSVHIEIDELEN